MQRRTRPKVRKFSEDSASENDQELVIDAVGRDAKMTARPAQELEQEADYQDEKENIRRNEDFQLLFDPSHS